MFFSCVYDETWWPISNIHLSYKPPSSRMILFCSGVCPRQFSCMKRFRAIVVPCRRCCKGIIIQGRKIKSIFSCGRPVMIENNRWCNRSICTWTQKEEYSILIYGQTVYLQYKTIRTPSLANPPEYDNHKGSLILGPVARLISSPNYLNPSYNHQVCLRLTI